MNQRIIVNRWFDKGNGAKKRVDSLFFDFWADAEEVKQYLHPFDSIKLTTYFMRKYNLRLGAARDAMVAFVGHYDNDKQSIHFNRKNYDNGVKVWQSIKERVK